MTRRGFSMLEALVVVLIASVVLGGLIAFLVQSQSWSMRATDVAVSASELRIALARISREVREARQVLYPAAGRKPQAALGLVSPRGESVFFRLVPAKDAPKATPFDLVREVVGGRTEVVQARVTRLVVSVTDPGLGREPALARVLLTRATGQGPDSDSGVSMFTSAAARAVLTRCLALRGEEP